MCETPARRRATLKAITMNGRGRVETFGVSQVRADEPQPAEALPHSCTAIGMAATTRNAMRLARLTQT